MHVFKYMYFIMLHVIYAVLFKRWYYVFHIFYQLYILIKDLSREVSKNSIEIKEIQLNGKKRIWRTVPSRSWQATHAKGELSSSKEVLLLHKPNGKAVLN